MEQHIKLGMDSCILYLLHCTVVHPTINMILSQVLSIIKDLIIIIIILTVCGSKSIFFDPQLVVGALSKGFQCYDHLQS